MGGVMNKSRLLAIVLAVALCASLAASGPSDIADAAQAKNAAAVKKLLKDGADVNAAQGDGMPQNAGALPTSSGRVPPLDLKRIAFNPVFTSSALSTPTNMMPVTPRLSCLPMFSAALAGFSAISCVLTTTAWLRCGLGDVIRMPAADMPITLVEISSLGDHVTDIPLSHVEGTGFFTASIEQALLANEVDIAVHSYKDLPVAVTPGLDVAAVPERGPIEDVLCARDGRTLDTLPAGARIGTCSARRSAQVRMRGRLATARSMSI